MRSLSVVRLMIASTSRVRPVVLLEATTGAMPETMVAITEATTAVTTEATLVATAETLATTAAADVTTLLLHPRLLPLRPLPPLLVVPVERLAVTSRSSLVTSEARFLPPSPPVERDS